MCDDNEVLGKCVKCGYIKYVGVQDDPRTGSSIF